MRPIHIAIKGIKNAIIKDNRLNNICRLIIFIVEEILSKKPKHSHIYHQAVKILYIEAGNYAFACNIFQQSANKKLQLLEFESKRWPYEIQSYSEAEKYALTLQEIIKIFFSFLASKKKSS